MAFTFDMLAEAAYDSYLESDVFIEHAVVSPVPWEELPPQIQELWLNAVKSLAGLVDDASDVQTIG